MRWFVQDRRETDETLVERAQKGDGGAVCEIMLRYKNAVRARARQFFLEGGETEDLVQEGMIGLYSAITAYSRASGKSFKNFAYLCVSRQIYDALRKAGKTPKTEGEAGFDFDTLSGGDTPEDFLIDDESRAELNRKLMKELSDFEFRVITMYLGGMSYAEIAEAAGKDVKSVDNALSRAKKKLQKAFTTRKG
ncbi:MAG: sigma-70 family RNA polymerase sigma factor [Clostridia bacterium]|nr:sigma-70 family RNA polymerase sigma factor [Clostridia bacterium]